MQPNCYCDDCVVTRDWFRDNAPKDEKQWVINVLPTEAYRMGFMKPSYPVPTLIGQVIMMNNEIIITDCDERCDPRLCFAWLGYRNELITDEPHDSPNYR